MSRWDAFTSQERAELLEGLNWVEDQGWLSYTGKAMQAELEALKPPPPPAPPSLPLKRVELVVHGVGPTSGTLLSVRVSSLTAWQQLLFMVGKRSSELGAGTGNDLARYSRELANESWSKGESTRAGFTAYCTDGGEVGLPFEIDWMIQDR